MRRTARLSLASAMCLATLGPAGAAEVQLAQAKAGAEKPGKAAGVAVTVRGTIAAVDKEKQTVTLKGPKGRMLTLNVQDPAKLDAVKVGDPVVATYYEAVAIQVVKKGAGATPGMSVQESRVGSKPGETPAGAIGRQVTITGTVTAVDKKAQTVTVRGPQGNSERVKVREAKNLAAVNVGDLVELTFTQALAVSLDAPKK